MTVRPTLDLVEPVEAPPLRWALQGPVVLAAGVVLAVAEEIPPLLALQLLVA